ncbi:sensor histidine kinase [Flavobacterium beibuense]|uniref:Oxygen sensor histidine kinase NreB n=1 Tax=Flavobacterium beibuense TaxID=657326 RepID=A0A444WAB7_9FLAO|nr:sensor histidine kinase [Flavobacterium beibuense]RYJ42733.1 Two-component system sensor histidine kinase [Flavobacterium beibuense]
MLKKLHIAVFIAFLSISTAYGQYSKQLLSLESKIESGNHEEVLKRLNTLDTSKFTLYNKALYLYLKAKCYDFRNSEDLAFKNFILSKKKFIAIDSIDRAMDINLDIAFLLYAQENSGNNYSKYINEYLNYAKNTNNNLKLARGYGNLAMLKIDEGKYSESKDYFHEALFYVKKTDNKNVESALNNNLANLYNEYLHQPDSALYYLKKDLLYVKDRGTLDDYYMNYLNQSSSYYYKKEYKTSIEYLKKADSLPINNYVVKSKQYLYENFQTNYDSLKDYKNAYKYALLVKKFADSANVIEQNIAINDIQTKYQTREKELENEVLKGKVKTNKALVYIVVGLLIASLIIGFLIVKNARRREHISKQEKLIEQQKLEKALKEYELSSIDLMLEGQEKERQRIANDLHDNLGSMLATLKINFEHLRLRKNELQEEENKLYDRTDELIEEAYQKVRRLAHAKNAGVFANEGLIPTIRKMAEKISIPGKLSIEVMAVGFNKRLENTIEIAIFRMVQELSTNIIKHSHATEASIQLTNHDENINIIIEDNGVGFPPAKTHTSDGMGLNTIRKKVEQLGGTFTIDSTPGKGTTIIIDLPI